MSQAAVERSAQSGPISGRKKSASITPGAIANATAVDVNFAFTEAEVGDVASVSFDDALVAGILFAGASIHAKGTVILRFSNITGAPVTQVAIRANVHLQKSVGA